MLFVYAIYNSISKKIYIGQTNNLERRLKEHNLKKGTHFTAKTKGTWTVIYKEDVLDRKNALIREKQLKSYRGRKFIKQYIPVEV